MDSLEISPKQKSTLRWFASDERMLFLSGAVRSGKSFSLDLGWLIWTQGNFTQPHDFIIGGDSVGSIKRNIFPDMERLATNLGIPWKYNHVGSYVQAGHHKYHLFGSKDADSVNAIRGMTAAGALLDEMTLMHPDFISMVITRMSVDGAKLVTSMNPDAPMHFVRTDYLNRAERLNGSVYEFGLKDNPTLSAEYIQMLKDTLMGADYERLVEGKWVANSGLVYPYIKISKAPSGRPLTHSIAIDYSTSGTVAFLHLNKYSSGRTHCRREFYHSAEARDNAGNVLNSKQLTDEQLADELDRFVKKGRLDRNRLNILPDPSAASFKRVLFERGYDVRVADNDVIQGIRVTNRALHRHYITVDISCLSLLRELSTYVWDKDACEKGEDKPVKTDMFHGVDALRYYGLKNYKYLSDISGPIAKPEGL